MTVRDFFDSCCIENTRQGHKDTLPTARQFGIKYPELRKAKVTITLWWGDYCAGEDSFNVSFYQWLRIVRGEQYFRRIKTSYEGDSVVLEFSFSKDGIIVTNDDGGTIWEGQIDDICYKDRHGYIQIEGPIIEDKDIAKAFLLYYCSSKSL